MNWVCVIKALEITFGAVGVMAAAVGLGWGLARLSEDHPGLTVAIVGIFLFGLIFTIIYSDCVGILK
jgi:hypothetical protein